MEKYYRIDVPENLYLHSDAETEDFGTGVYPISVISRKSHFKDDTDTVKLACFKMRRKSRLLFLIGCLVFLLVFVLVIIIATKKHDEAKAEITTSMKKEVKQRGLIFQPSVDDIPYIHYSLRDMKTYAKYLNLLQFFVYEYASIQQQTPDYVDCYNGSAADGKACRLTDYQFGSHCTHENAYGYSQGRPCVLLRLQLDDNSTIDPFTESDIEIKNKLKDRWAANHVGITCNGETEEDRHHMGNESFWCEDGVQEYSIAYHPPTGFPVWFYPKKNNHYKIPAVMVHFNTIHSQHLVTIKCVAWAKNFNNGMPQDSNVYSTRFQIYIE